MMSAASTRTPHVLVVVNSPTSGIRSLGAWLEAAGLELDLRLGEEGLPAALLDYDGLIMLGGGFMPDDYERAPWLRDERRLAAEAVDRDVPTLGICLGAQLLADLSDGEVLASHGIPERGATAVQTTAAGAADPVISALAPEAYVIENHEDMVTRIPSSAVLLASSEHCTNQAFRIGEHVRGVQFHPEVRPDQLLNWNEAALAQEGLHLADLVAGAREHEAENTRRCHALSDAFAAQVVARAAARRGAER